MKKREEVTNKNKKTQLIITGGGSGGHLNTAISVIKYIQKNDHSLANSLLYIGGKRGMIGDTSGSIESRKIPETGVDFIAINSGKLHRKFNFTSIKLLGGVFLGFIDSFMILIKKRPKLIFSSGGYVTLPLIISAWFLRIPSIIHEQTIAAGLANKIAAKFATHVLITFPDSQKFFPVGKTEVVGAPLQESRFNNDLSTEISNKLSSDYLDFLKKYKRNNSTEKPRLFITGGGLGSHKLNTWLLNNLQKIDEKFLTIVVTGENELFSDYQRIIEQIKKLNLTNTMPVKWYADEVGYILANTDLVIARPGANTVLELLATNNKAILLPIKWSSANEQFLNAEYFMKNQVGMIVDEDNLDEEISIPLIKKYASISPKSSKSKVSLNATSKIYEIINQHLQ